MVGQADHHGLALSITCGQVSHPVLCLTSSLPPLVAQASSPWIEHTSFSTSKILLPFCGDQSHKYQVSQDKVLPMIDRWCDFRFSIGQLPRQLPSKRPNEWEGREETLKEHVQVHSRYKIICEVWVVSEIKDFARSSPSAFFQQVTPLMNSEKWEKFVTTPRSRYNCQNTPARKKTLLLYHHQQCSVGNYRNFQTLPASSFSYFA